MRYCLLLVLLLAALAARAQVFDPRQAVPPDSLHTEAAEALARLGPQPDSLRRRFNQERMLVRLKAYSHRKTIAGKALAALFDFNRRQAEPTGLDAALLDRQFDQHLFKVVRQVNIITYDAFGYSLTDSTRVPHTFLDRAGNALHIKTSRARIRQLLLVRPGEPLQPQALAESERLLRQSPQILDARVLVNAATTTRDSVDIEVLTTDVFSLTGSAELSTATAGRVGLGDVNFLGLGHQLSNTYTYGRNLAPNEPGGPPAQTWAYQGRYTAPFRHFITAQARYKNEHNQRVGGVSVRRDFYSPSTKYAGAFSSDRNQYELVPVPPPPGEPLVFQPLHYHVHDLWLGRALRLRSYDLGYENPGRLIVSARAIRTDYQARPVLPPGQGVDYYDGTLLLGTVGYSVRRYYKDRFLFGFGRTEDVPTGTLVSFTAGRELNDVVPRRYLSGRLSAGTFSADRGYAYGSMELGTYQRLDHTRLWEQGMLNTETTFFTRLYRAGRGWQYRHFLNARAAVGLRRRPGEYLFSGISNNQGIRGFSPNPGVRATSRFSINYETTLYTPLSLLGFRLAGIAFADAVWVTERVGGGSPFGSRPPFTGFGVGIRLRNEFTALRTVQLLIGFYPRGQITPNGLKSFETSREAVSFPDFGIGAPQVGYYQ